jgi:hypothetical protein
MPKLSLFIPELAGGVSTQPPILRHLNQVQGASNAMFTIRTGLEKRPGTKFAFVVYGLSPSGSYRMQAINRDGTEKYLVVYGRTGSHMDLVPYDSLGNPQTLFTDLDAQTYMDANSAVDNDLRLVTVADYTLLLNTTVATASQTSGNYTVTATNDTYTIITSRLPDKDQYFRATENDGGHTAGYYKYLVAAADNGFAKFESENLYPTRWAEHTEYWNDTGNNPMGFKIGLQRHALSITGGAWDATNKTLTKTNAFQYYITWSATDQIYVTGGTGVTAGWYTIASKDTDSQITLTTSIKATNASDVTTNGIGREFEVMEDFYANQSTSMYDIAKRLQTALRSAGAANAIIQYDPNGRINGSLVLISHYRGTNCAIRTLTAPSSGFDLSSSSAYVPLHYAGGTATDGSGGYIYPQTLSITDRWQQVPAPGQAQAVLDNTTLPAKIVRTTYGAPSVFTVSLIDWVPRYTGDDITNPVPSIIKDGKAIADIAFHRNRLGIAGDENLVLGQAGDFFNFFLEDADNIVDSDPIDIALSADRVTLVEFVLPFRKELVIFTKAGQQFELNAPETLTPNTASITPSTGYSTISDVRPSIMGNQIYFASLADSGVQVYEYFYDDSAASNNAANITSHAEGYLPATIRSIASCVNQNMVLVLPSASNEVYVYRSFWSGVQKVQSAWNKWTFLTGTVIHDITILDDDAWALVERAGSFYVLRVNLGSDLADNGFPYPIRLDCRHTETGVYSAGTGKTTWTLPLADSSLDCLVLGNAFGANAGKILTPTNNGTTSITYDGDYSAGPVQIGRKYTMDVELTRPYVRDTDNTYLDGHVSLLRIRTNHSNTGTYTVRITDKEALRADRDFVFSAGTADDDLEEEGTFTASVMGEASKTEIHLVSTSPRPCNITTVEYEAVFTPRSL